MTTDDRPPYLDVLAAIHRRFAPRTYLEVGLRNGWSFAQASCAAVGIDPEFEINAELSGRIQLRRTTSDDYFAREDPKVWLGGPIDLAFIDGMHLAEYALRDFINIERHCTWSSVVIFDDVLPRTSDEAARDRHTQAWTGDVFRVREILAEHRPDLTLTVLDTNPTGLLLVTGLDPTSRVLDETFDAIVAAHVHPDPQEVPDPVLHRTGTVRVDALFGSEYFDTVAPGRRRTARRVRQLHDVTAALA